MILLSWEYLLFELESGECVPFSADAVSVELAGEEDSPFDAEFLQHATKAVFHYFRSELERDSVTVAEFSNAMEWVLRGFLYGDRQPAETLSARPASPSDLQQLAEGSEQTELLFYQRLRDELRVQLHKAYGVLRFRGLRGCVKQLSGARRWSPRCRALQDQILDYLRACAAVDRAGRDCTLVVE